MAAVAIWLPYVCLARMIPGGVLQSALGCFEWSERVEITPSALYALLRRWSVGR